MDIDIYQQRVDRTDNPGRVNTGGALTNMALKEVDIHGQNIRTGGQIANIGSRWLSWGITRSQEQKVRNAIPQYERALNDEMTRLALAGDEEKMAVINGEGRDQFIQNLQEQYTKGLRGRWKDEALASFQNITNPVLDRVNQQFAQEVKGSGRAMLDESIENLLNQNLEYGEFNTRIESLLSDATDAGYIGHDEKNIYLARTQRQATTRLFNNTAKSVYEEYGLETALDYIEKYEGEYDPELDRTVSVSPEEKEQIRNSIISMADAAKAQRREELITQGQNWIWGGVYPTRESFLADMQYRYHDLEASDERLLMNLFDKYQSEQKSGGSDETEPSVYDQIAGMAFDPSVDENRYKDTISEALKNAEVSAEDAQDLLQFWHNDYVRGEDPMVDIAHNRIYGDKNLTDSQKGHLFSQFSRWYNGEFSGQLGGTTLESPSRQESLKALENIVGAEVFRIGQRGHEIGAPASGLQQAEKLNNALYSGDLTGQVIPSAVQEVRNGLNSGMDQIAAEDVVLQQMGVSRLQATDEQLAIAENNVTVAKYTSEVVKYFREVTGKDPIKTSVTNSGVAYMYIESEEHPGNYEFFRLKVNPETNEEEFQTKLIANEYAQNGQAQEMLLDEQGWWTPDNLSVEKPSVLREMFNPLGTIINRRKR